MSRKYSPTLLLAMLIMLMMHASNAIGMNDVDNTPLPQSKNHDQEYTNSKISPKPFDRETWNKNREGLDYNDKKVSEELEKQKSTSRDKSADGERLSERQQQHSYSEPWTINLGNTGQILLIIAVVVLLALLVFVILKMGLLNSNTQIKATAQDAQLLDNIEENIHESDLERALRLALEAKDYRLAIRIYYLSILKELSLRELILWKRDKTNGQYVREMLDKPGGIDFRALTLSFERAWYSDETVTQKQYETLNPQFQSFINALKKR